MKNRVLLITIAVLVIAVGVLAYLNQQGLGALQSQDNPRLRITAQGEEVAVLELQELIDLGAHEFQATLRSSGSPDRDSSYRGVSLKAVLEHVDPGLVQRAREIIARAEDGYVVAYSIDELQMADHLYVVFEEEGKPLAGKGQGGSGPLLLMARQDEFGQRWCKFLVEVSLGW